MTALSRRPIVRLLGLTQGHRAAFAAMIALNVVGGAITVAPPILYQWLVDEARIAETSRELLIGAVWLLVFAFLSFANSWLFVVFGNRLAAKVRASLRRRMFEAKQSMAVAYFRATPAGESANNIVSDTEILGNATAIVIPTIIYSVTVLIASALFVASVQPVLFIVILLFTPMFLSNRILGTSVRQRTLEFLEARAALNGRLTYALSVEGHLRAVGLTGQTFQRRQLGDLIDADAMTTARAEAARGLYGTFVGLSSAAALGGAYVIGLLLVREGRITLGAAVGLGAVLVRVQQPLGAFSSVLATIRSAEAALLRLDEQRERQVTFAQPRVVSTPNPEAPPGVVFTALSFRHTEFEAAVGCDSALTAKPSQPQDAPWLLRDIDLTIDNGTCCALIGRSGAGKSTIGGLICGHFIPTQGTVTVNGWTPATADPELFRWNAAMVGEEALIDNVTIRQNLLGIRPDASERRLIECCREAEVYDLISELPEGLDTMLGERGFRLSTGQRQRLAIAQLFVLDPLVAIFDEVTANLDESTEQALLPAIARATQGRTSLLISHRRSTVAVAERVLELRDGRVVDSDMSLG